MYEDEHLESDYESRNGSDVEDLDEYDEYDEDDEMTEEDRTYEIRYFEQHSPNQSI